MNAKWVNCMMCEFNLNKAVIKNNNGDFRSLLILKDQFCRTSGGSQTHPAKAVRAGNGTALMTAEIESLEDTPEPLAECM